jgi:2-keto-4-pentenoate hydratase/2-oxohepta-3-ene-1,7-dioic acid hydratase in catechol pathway
MRPGKSLELTTKAMKYCRFQHNNQAHYGLIESVAGREEITRVLLTSPEDCGGDMEDMASKRMDHVPLNEAILLAPVRPSKIVCVGRNYREHAAELGNEVPQEPLLFFKPPSSLNVPGGEIRRPTAIAQRVDHEGELGLVIARTCYKLRPDEDVKPYILGYTCVNDVTARDLQNKDGQWTRAKGFDTFCPVGPLVTDEIDPWTGISVATHVNGELRQSGNTRDFIFALEVVLRHITGCMTLAPGDLIATGTPKGVGPMQAGDVVEVSVDGVGTLRNTVVDD